MNKKLSSISGFVSYRTKLINASLFFLLTVSFLILTYFVLSNRSAHWDYYISGILQHQQHAVLDTLMKGFSWLGKVRVAFFAICFTSLCFLMYEKKREAILVGSTILTGAISWTLKMLIDRPRPGADVVRVIEETKYQSFPSGHVLFYTVFFGLLSIIVFYARGISGRIRGIMIFLLVLMIACGAVSRIYLGAHWFTDILGGFIVGIQFLLIARLLYLKNKA
ncbi:phosphatase PAP2 family protein [Chryseobacterium sp. SSA4.19]|uniref:phosphatase PAP2 family protein n=1 Tax=Chryseobacterium sp. SSA4.19 TaxID=2919915 RepID=UPI001F4E6AA9|nr:phosphatase PAP2 family protein [Chryseobacterium sp. SSA4.19]MCJ8155112.1 phosphatase PAP2 family protein [Chryseobacterium sp. SSA4.19]